MKINRFSLVLLMAMAFMLALSTVTKAQTIDVCYNVRDGSLRLLLSDECRKSELALSLYTKEDTDGLVSDLQSQIDILAQHMIALESGSQDLQSQIDILAKHILALESGGPKSATLTIHTGAPSPKYFLWFDLETADEWNGDGSTIPSQYDIAFFRNTLPPQPPAPQIRISSDSQGFAILPNCQFDSVDSAYGLGLIPPGNNENHFITNTDTIVIHTNEGKYFKIGDVVFNLTNMTATFRYAQIFPLE